MGTFLLAETLGRRPEVGLDSYDRFFPNQDTLPKGGFGNLIALPFQAIPRQKDNTVFLDEEFRPFADQWAYLSSIQRMTPEQVEALVRRMGRAVHGIGIGFDTEVTESPWNVPPSGVKRQTSIKGPLPAKVDIILANQLYIEKTGLPSVLTRQLMQLAAFSNPEFYRAQALRLSTHDKPRFISCAEEFQRKPLLQADFRW